MTSFDVLYSLDEPDERAAMAEMFCVGAARRFRADQCRRHGRAARRPFRPQSRVRRYSRSDLERLVAGAGFTVVRLTYTNIALFLPLAGLRMVQRWRG